MKLNIIHLPNRVDRMITLRDELRNQKVQDYTIWPGIIEKENAAIGISKAHKQIITHAKNNNLPAVMVAEDDLHFTSSGAYNYFLSNIPFDFDMYLGSVFHGVVKDDNSVVDFAGLTLYIVNSRFYDTILDADEILHLDRALKGKGKYIVCNPFVVTQHDGYSDNKKRCCSYAEYFKYRKTF